MGGLSKKAYQIKAISGEQRKPALVVDSGNLLFKQSPMAEGPSQERVIAEGIIGIYSAMQVDAVAVGPLDLAAGAELLLTSQKQGFPWLSANLFDPQGRPLFEPTRIKKIGSIKAGLIGLTGTLDPLPAGITQADWRTILPALVAKTASQCDFLILLSSLSAADNQEIAQLFPAIHLILTANPDTGNMNPQQINNSLITQTDRQGKYLGVLSIDWNQGGKWGHSREEELITLRNRLGALDWQLQRMQKRKDQEQPDYLDKIRVIEQNREEVAEQIRSLEAQNQLPGNEKDAWCSHSFHFVPLQQSLPDAPEIKDMVMEIRQRIKELHTKIAQRETEQPFLGSDGCTGCHAKQGAFWQTTSHARAWETLEKRDQAHNLECLPCHVVNQPELNLPREQLLFLPASLQAVGCESCHLGPGKAHAKNPGRFPMEKPVEEKTCLLCHASKQDNNFSYREKSAQIACPVE